MTIVGFLTRGTKTLSIYILFKVILEGWSAFPSDDNVFQEFLMLGLYALCI